MSRHGRTTPPRARIAVTSALLVVAGLIVACRGPVEVSREASSRPTTATRQAPLPRPPAPPDLESLDPTAHERIRRRHATVERMLEGGASTSGLSWAFGELGKAYHAYLDIERARRCYSHARQLDPEEPRWAYLLGIVESVQGERAAAERAFLDTLALRPGDVPSLVALAEEALQAHDLVAAERYFEQARHGMPRAARILHGLARIAMARGDQDKALELLMAAQAEQPQATSILYALGQAWRASGDLDRARGFFDRLPKSALARVEIRFEDPFLEDVAALADSTQIYARRGQRAISRGQFHLAVRELERAVDSDPDRPDTRYNLAASLLRLGRRDEAFVHLEEVVDRAPDYVPARVLRARLRLADKLYSAAREDLEHALSVDSGAASIHLALRELALAEGNPSAAAAHAARARELSPALAGSPRGSAPRGRPP